MVVTAVAGDAGGGVEVNAPTSNDEDGAGVGDAAFVAAGVGSGSAGSPEGFGVPDALGVADAAGAVAPGGGVCACDAVTPNAPTAPAAPIASATSFVLSFMGHLLREPLWARPLRFPHARSGNLDPRVKDRDSG